ncbi:MAG TPA: PIG-L family deacetylase [bacterium (Candidatus Stahlbacteria)]|nr:PIG-L family deacetylase [Candidatus Stahlbacteria bacterium]
MPKSTKVRLVIVAHTDDAELCAGGTIALWTQTDPVYYIIVTCGEKGSWERDTSPYDIAKMREGEALKAAEFLGVKKVIFLRHGDGAVSEVKTLKLELAALVRKLKPSTIVSHDPWARWFHPDHRATGWAVIEAVMIARDYHFYPFLLELGLRPHRVEDLLLGPTDEPNFIVDISDTFKKKLEAIKIHESQLNQLPDWERRITRRAKVMGEIKRCDYGEGFYQLFI